MNDIKIITFDTIQKEIRSKTLLWLFVFKYFIYSYCDRGDKLRIFLSC